MLGARGHSHLGAGVHDTGGSHKGRLHVPQARVQRQKDCMLLVRSGSMTLRCKKHKRCDAIADRDGTWSGSSKPCSRFGTALCVRKSVRSAQKTLRSGARPALNTGLFASSYIVAACIHANRAGALTCKVTGFKLLQHGRVSQLRRGRKAARGWHTGVQPAWQHHGLGAP